jgi:hypothetical protein
MFFTYRQNNSGGSFEEDEKSGIGVTVIVEADNADEANARAKDIGLYFDGAGDCECCGYRWSEAYPEEVGDEVPSIYGEPIDFDSAEGSNISVMGYNYKVMGFVHYKDGQIKTFWF